MSDLLISQISSALPVSRPAPVQPVRRDLPTNVPADRQAPKPSTVAATTGGNLRAAYAQFVTDPETHDTVVRIRDANTNAVISESPTPEIQAMAQAFKAYLVTVARHQAALHAVPTG